MIMHLTHKDVEDHYGNAVTGHRSTIIPLRKKATVLFFMALCPLQCLFGIVDSHCRAQAVSQLQIQNRCDLVECLNGIHTHYPYLALLGLSGELFELFKSG